MEQTTTGDLRSLAVPSFTVRDGQTYCAPFDRAMQRQDPAPTILVSAGTVSDEIAIKAISRGGMSYHSLTFTAAEAAALGAELIQAACFLQRAKHKHQEAA